MQEPAAAVKPAAVQQPASMPAAAPVHSQQTPMQLLQQLLQGQAPAAPVPPQAAPSSSDQAASALLQLLGLGKPAAAAAAPAAAASQPAAAAQLLALLSNGSATDSSSAASMDLQVCQSFAAQLESHVSSDLALLVRGGTWSASLGFPLFGSYQILQHGALSVCGCRSSCCSKPYSSSQPSSQL